MIDLGGLKTIPFAYTHGFPKQYLSTMDTTDKVFRHLPDQKKFVKILSRQFEEEQYRQILLHLKDPDIQLDDDLFDEFTDWLREYFQDNAKEILTIGWDCYSGGSPMSDGAAWYSILHGVVIVASTDVGPEYQNFNRKKFFPWYPEGLMTDMIEMVSEYFSTEELMEFMLSMLDWENEGSQDIYINDVQYSIDYESQTISPKPVNAASNYNSLTN
jgi:hypothetical protein